MENKKALVVTTTLFVALLFLSSLASEPTNRCLQPVIRKSSGKPIVKENTSAKSPNRKQAKSLRKRLDRFVGRRKDIDLRITKLHNRIQKSSDSKRASLDHELRHLQQRRNRITKRMEQLAVNIGRIEGTKVVVR